MKDNQEVCPWLKKESVRNALLRHRKLMLMSRVDDNVSHSVAEQEPNETVETNDNSEMDDSTIAAKAGRPCSAGATKVRKAT